jgi:type VI secretion system secreted protein Hcp
MALDMFIKIEGIDGESKDDAHADEIDVLSWSWGASQSGTFHTGGGGGAGKVNVNDLSFTKWVDKASTPLFLHVCNGAHIDSATLTVRKSGGEPVEYMVIEMEKLMVTSYSTGGSGGEDSLTECVTLNFAKVKCKYQPQADDGSPDGGTIDNGWDIEANIEWA